MWRVPARIQNGRAVGWPEPDIFVSAALFRFFLSFFFFFYSTLCIIDLVIRITLLCYLLHYLTSCSVDWCGGFATNLVVIIHIMQLFILEFHLNTHTPHHIYTYTHRHTSACIHIYVYIYVYYVYIYYIYMYICICIYILCMYIIIYIIIASDLVL